MRHRVFATLFLLSCLLIVPNGVAVAADDAFVGILALALDPAVVQEIGISDQTRSALEDFVNDRESEALEMALNIRDLPQAQQQQRLDAFRLESEQQGLRLLDAATRKALEAVRIRQTGYMSLGEAKVAAELELSDEQRDEVAQLLAERENQLKEAGGARAVAVRQNFERQLKLVLTPTQVARWQSVAGAQPESEPERTMANASEQQADSAAPASPVKRIPNGDTSPSGELQFSFRYAPWQNVIEWFAEQCDLSLLMDAPPQGTFNYSDPRTYSQAQAIDLLNSVLLTKGFTLIRREKMLQVVNLEDGIPPNLVAEVTEEELDELGEYELVRCIFSLESVNAEDAKEEIDRLLGPQGTVNVLTSSNQLAITETAGRLRTFRSILQQGERQNASALGQAQIVPLEYERASKIIAAWRKLMGLGDEDNATLDGSLRVTQGKSSRELLVSGRAKQVKEFQALVKILDVPARGGPRDVPQLEVYAITEADPESVLNVLDTLLEGVDDVRLATDPKSRSLIALARPSEQETIRATIDQLQSDRRQVEVIRLRTIDPQLAMLSIEKLFSPPSGDEEGTQLTAPVVDADPVTRSLMIRGSQAQIEDIRTLLNKMGEDESAPSRRGIAGDGGKLRMIPIDAGTARRTLQQLHTIWPTVRENRIRTVTPSSHIRGIRINNGIQAVPRIVPPAARESDRDARTAPSAPSRRILEEGDTTQNRPPTSPETSTRFVVSQVPESESETTDASDQDASQLDLPDVIVTIGDQGMLIASEDVAALDEFEELFRTLSDRLFAGSRELSIFYLRYAKADVAAEFVKQFVGGSGSGGGGGGTLLGNLAGAALGNAGGGIIGTLLGGGGGGSSSVSLSKGTAVIADPRLNALVVQATPKELDFIEELLRVLDRANSPEVIETVPRPRAIPVYHADASDVAEVVRSVYATRLAGGQSGRERQPSPEEFLKAISGQSNTKKEIASAIGDQVGITISVDPRRNALYVVAPESLFQEIKALVAELDFEAPEREETIRYGSVGNSSPEMIRTLIDSLMSDDPAPRSINEKRNEEQQPQPTEAPNRAPRLEEMKRRMEFLKAIQKANAGNQAAALKKKAAARQPNK